MSPHRLVRTELQKQDVLEYSTQYLTIAVEPTEASEDIESNRKSTPEAIMNGPSIVAGVQDLVEVLPLNHRPEDATLGRFTADPGPRFVGLVGLVASVGLWHVSPRLQPRSTPITSPCGLMALYQVTPKG
ncbi:MAG: hypothetical protein Q9194_002353 [Teloschistes cf. exilis]